MRAAYAKFSQAAIDSDTQNQRVEPVKLSSELLGTHSQGLRDKPGMHELPNNTVV